MMRTLISYNAETRVLILYNGEGLISVMRNCEWPVVHQIRQGMADADRFTRENPKATLSQLLTQLQ